MIKKQNPIVIYFYIVWSHGNYKVDTRIGFGSRSFGDEESSEMSNFIVVLRNSMRDWGD